MAVSRVDGRGHRRACPDNRGRQMPSQRVMMLVSAFLGLGCTRVQAIGVCPSSAITLHRQHGLCIGIQYIYSVHVFHSSSTSVLTDQSPSYSNPLTFWRPRLFVIGYNIHIGLMSCCCRSLPSTLAHNLFPCCHLLSQFDLIAWPELDFVAVW
jgi:hypothetical protein